MQTPWTACKRLAGLALAGWLLVARLGWGAEAPKVPEPQGYANDYANVLSEAEKQRLNNLSESLKAATGAEMAFVIMPDIEPYDDFTYGMAVFNAWKLGEKGKDNGLLILLALKEHRLRIITGYGLESILPDGKVGRFRDEYLVPYLRQGQTGEGLANLGQALAQEIAQAEGKNLNGVPPPRRRPADNAALLRLIFMVVILVIFSILPRLGRRRGFGGFFLGGGGANFGGGGGGFGGGFGGFGGGFSGGGGVGGGW